jgi:hypothetical protein
LNNFAKTKKILIFLALDITDPGGADLQQKGADNKKSRAIVP